MICEFKGANGYLSNFALARFDWAGVTWNSSEHAFAWAKTFDEEWRRRIMVAAKPGDAKRLGRAAPLRPDWDEIKVWVMDSIVCAKFLGRENYDLADRLIATGDSTLVEGNSWGDRFWGAVYAETPRSGEMIWKLDAQGVGVHLVGFNELGRVLMRVRDDLRMDRELRAQMLRRELVEKTCRKAASG